MTFINIKRGSYVSHDGKMYKYKSLLELRWMRYLDVLQAGGAIKGWDYEIKKFIFDCIRHGTTRYLPDFRVFENDDSTTIHETKGILDGRSFTKLKRLKLYYPEQRVWLILMQKMTGKTKRKLQQIERLEKLTIIVDRVVIAKPIFKQLGII